MPGIDGLRAIAVIGVFLYHLNVNWLPGGFLGVTVFFVLSGYLITDILIDEWNQHNKIYVIHFLIRRVRRLLPAFIVLLFLVTAWVTLTNHPSFEKLKTELLPSFLYIINWWYIFHEYSYFESFGPPSPLTHIWSLAIEEQFYLIWPVLIILMFSFLKRTRIRVLVIVAGVIISACFMALLYLPGSDPSRVYYGTDTRAFSLLLGAALAFVWPSQRLSSAITKPASRILDSVGVAGLIGIVMMFFITSQYHPFLYRGGMFLLSVFTLFVVAVLAHPASKLGKWLALKPFRWIGERSYGVYLWHYPIIVLTTPVVNTAGIEIIRVFFQIIATLVLSALSYRFVETPIRSGKLAKVREAFRTFGSKSLYQKTVILGSSIVFLVLIIGVGAAFVADASQKEAALTTPRTVEPLEEIDFGKEVEVLAPEPQPDEKEEISEPPSITIIGDSILYDVIPFFKNLYPETIFDYRVGRQMSEVPEVMNQLKEKGQLGDYVFIQIGTNGPFVKSQLITVIESLNDKKVFLVNSRVPRPWEKVVNSTLEEVVKSQPNTILVDWYSASADHAEYFAQDGVHLTKTGGEVYANLLADQLD